MPEPQQAIMIVDDTPFNLQLLEAMLLQKNYRVFSFTSGSLALEAAQKCQLDLVLLDIMMPDMDGYEVCQRLKSDSRLSSVPVIFLSGLNETMDKVKAFRVGGVDYVNKPFEFEEVHARIETHLKLQRMQRELANYSNCLAERVQEQIQEISDSQMATIFALAKLTESRDDNTGKHIERVQTYCRVLAEQLGRQSPYREIITPRFLNNIYYASPLHDIGKIAVPDRVLLKPGKLTPEEFSVMKSHTLIGAKTLAKALARYPRNEFIRTGMEIARSHHERWDGGGYPDGASGQGISLYARITSVADVYDALRSQRCYRPALSHEEAYKLVMAGAGTQFDPAVVAAFDQMSDEFRRISVEEFQEGESEEA